MELIFKNDLLPQNIEFNFEDLKNEIAESVKQYAGLVYTDDQITEAKADRARLRKFADVLDQARKQVKKDCLAPYQKFEEQVKILMDLLNEPISLIDKQVKEYEDKLRVDKEQQIIKLFKEMDHPEEMFLARIWSDKWLNATYSMKKITEEITAGIERWKTEMAMIDRLSNPVAARMVYIDTMDLGKAIAESDRQDAIDKAREEEEIRAKVAEAMPQPVPAVEETATEPEIEQAKQWVCFRALLTPHQALRLRDFFISNNIDFEPIP